MEIGLVYSGNDPKQTEAREFVRDFIQQRGVAASLIESDRPVKSPTLIINGQVLKDRRKAPRDSDQRMFPGIMEISEVLERQLWSI